jgi:hypothetical protein
MEASAKLFQEISSQPLGIKKIDKLAASLAKSFKPTVASSLEKVNDLAFWLFVYEKNELSLRACRLLSVVPFNDNYNLWTWIETALALESKLLRLANDQAEAEQCLSKIRAPFMIGDEMHQAIKSRALTRRLSGELLQDDAITQAQDEGELDVANEYRFAHLKELVYIQALGGSDQLSVADIEDGIQATVRELIKS